MLQRLDPEQELGAYRVWDIWTQEVGAAIASRAQPSQVRNGVLVVTVATHAWLQELQFMKDALRERLNERLGAPIIRDIFLVAGHVDPPTAVEEPPAAAPEPAPPLVPLPALDDPALAATFARIMGAHARRTHSTGTTRKAPAGRRRRR